MEESFEVVPLPPSHFGDGSKNAWPKEQYWQQTDDRLYRQKLATMWMQKSGKLVRGLFLFLFFSKKKIPR
jgi:hypothetical protein